MCVCERDKERKVFGLDPKRYTVPGSLTTSDTKKTLLQRRAESLPCQSQPLAASSQSPHSLRPSREQAERGAHGSRQAMMVGDEVYGLGAERPRPGAERPRPPRSTARCVRLHPHLRWAPRRSSGEGLTGSHRVSLSDTMWCHS